MTFMFGIMAEISKFVKFALNIFPFLQFISLLNALQESCNLSDVVYT